MASLRNEWIGYVTRSYEQIKQDTLTKFQSLIPEMTDHTESNIFVKMISIWAGLIEMLGYYVDNKGREAFLPTAQQFSSAVKIASLFGFRIKGWRASSCDVTFFIDAPAPVDISIPIDTEVETAEGVKFFTTEIGTIQTGETQTIVQAIQRVKFEDIFIGTSNGTPNQEFILEGQVVDKAVSVLVGTQVYSFVEDFTFSSDTDFHFSTGINEDGEAYVRFGDGVNGVLPPIGANILSTYFLTSAEEGNVARGTITNIVSNVPVPSGLTLSVVNNVRASGGGQRDNLTDLKRRIPISHRTMDEAVTEFDYRNLALLVAGVAQAEIDFDCGKTVDVYVAPEGGGVASSALLQAVKDFYDEDRRMVTTLIETKSAGTLAVLLEIDITAEPDQFNGTVRQRVEDVLVQQISTEVKKIKEPLFLGDVYAFVENTEGVRNSRVRRMSLKPFGTIVRGINSLLWDVTLKADSTQLISWSVRMTDPLTFQLFKAGSFVGNFAVGDLLDFPEVRFTIQPNSYAGGDRWSFNTYPQGEDIFPDEFSIITAFPENLVLNVTGGI